MSTFIHGWGFTVVALALITVVFVVALISLGRELRFVRILTDFLGAELARPGGSEDARGGGRPEASIELHELRDQAHAIRTATDPAWANKQVRGWQMRAQRLEPALAFWIDFLRQLGLLFTVVGLGLSLAVGQGDVAGLLQPLALAVWTTVAGLAYSVLLSASYGTKIPVWTDSCEKNLEAWDEHRRAGRGVSA